MKNEDNAWVEYREKFSEIYDESNYSSSLQAWVMHASHKLTEKPFDENLNFDKVIEIGAGTGVHSKFIKHNFSSYTLTDLDENALKIAAKKISHENNKNYIFDLQQGSHLSYADSTFDRLVATHVLEHIYQPHLAIKEWIRVLKNGASISILIPTDPGIAWRLGRHLGPRKNAIKRGIAYDYIMAREHVNSCNNLIALLRHYFPEAKEAWWPFSLPSIDINLFFAFHATIKK